MGLQSMGHKDMTEHTHIWRRVKLKHKRLSTKTEVLDASEVLVLYLRVRFFVFVFFFLKFFIRVFLK